MLRALKGAEEKLEAEGPRFLWLAESGAATRS